MHLTDVQLRDLIDLKPGAAPKDALKGRGYSLPHVSALCIERFGQSYGELRAQTRLDHARSIAKTRVHLGHVPRTPRSTVGIAGQA